MTNDKIQSSSLRGALDTKCQARRSNLQGDCFGRQKYGGFAKTMLYICALLFVIILASAASVFADQKQWASTGDGIKWEDAANWFPSGIPAITDQVYINYEASSVTSSKNFSAANLFIGGKTNSSFTSNDFIYGTITPAGTTENALYIRKSGSVNMEGAGTVTLKGLLKITEDITPGEPAFMVTVN